jgi:uroporphyrinogen-III synthase
MKNIEKILAPLELLYYEYDKKARLLRLDNSWSKDHIFTELIRITYTLSKHNVQFFIDEEKSIILGGTDTIIARIKRYIRTFFTHLRNSRMKLYVLSQKKVKWAKNIPVFEIKPLNPEIDLYGYSALIFTSKNAITALDAIDKSWKSIPAYVIAPQTAKTVKDLGGKLEYVGKEKQGNAFAIELLEKLKNQKVLYVRGSKVVSDLITVLNANGVICDDVIVYETVCKKFDQKVELPQGSTIIFSSPSTIECFFENFSWDSSYKAVSIGETTAQYFPENIVPFLADTTSLESCVKKAIEINS